MSLNNRVTSSSITISADTFQDIEENLSRLRADYMKEGEAEAYRHLRILISHREEIKVLPAEKEEYYNGFEQCRKEVIKIIALLESKSFEQILLSPHVPFLKG